MGTIVSIKQELLDQIEDELMGLLYRNDPDDWDHLLISHRINDRISRIKNNIGFPKVKYNDINTRHNKLRHRNSG